MAFHFQCDLSPCLTNAAASRFLITTIPSCYYVSWKCTYADLFWWGSGVAVLPEPSFIKIKMEHTIKIEFQVFDRGVNLTLQAAAKVICGSLNQLADNGVCISEVPWPSNLQMAFFAIFVSLLECGL